MLDDVPYLVVMSAYRDQGAMFRLLGQISPMGISPEAQPSMVREALQGRAELVVHTVLARGYVLTEGGWTLTLKSPMVGGHPLVMAEIEMYIAKG